MQALALHLQSLKDNPGLLPVKEGQALIEVDKWTIIKTIRLDQIFDDLSLIINKYSEFKKLIDLNKPFPHDFIGMLMHTDYIRDITIDKYRQLVPQQKFKRGLLNPLGSIIKVITGNLDYEDAVKYDRLTSKLNHNQIIISKKITLVSQMMDSFINTTEIMQQNVESLNARLKKVEATLRELMTKESNTLFASYVLGLYSLFISNFRTIFIKLSEIETALALSKSSVLHQSIVNSTELLNYLQLIQKNGNLVYPPIESNLVQLEETMKVKSFTKGHQITFIMEIPLVENSTYNYFKLYTLPIFQEPENQTLAIFPEYPYLLAKGLKYFPMLRPCQALAAGDLFLCDEDDKAVYPGLTCVEQLMNFGRNLTRCHQHRIQVESVKVQKINTESWILYTEKENALKKQCNNEISNYPIKGTYLVTLDEPCSLEIQGIHMSSHSVYMEMEEISPVPVINLPTLRTTEATATTSPLRTLSGAPALNMIGVNLDEVKYMSRVLKENELNNSVSDRDNDFRINILFCITFSLIIIICIVIVLNIFKKKNNSCNTKLSEST